MCDEQQTMASEWKPRHKVMIVIAVCAAVIGAPVAVGAATGQLVNIIDPTNSTAARVDAGGSLRTNVVSGTISATNAVPKVPFQLVPEVTDFYQNGGVRPVISNPSTSTVAISDLLFTPINFTESWDFLLVQSPGATIAECRATVLDPAKRRIVMRHIVPMGVTTSEHFTTPLVVKPTGTTPYCLSVVGSSQTGTGGAISLSISGWVQSNSFTAPPTGSAREASTPGAAPLP